MKRKVIYPIIGAIILLIIFLVYFSYFKTSVDVCFDGVCVKSEVADSPRERARGLMFRDNLGENNGMIFMFDSSEKHAFWMKNTLIPLDIIWLDENLKVVDITTMTPCKKDPCVSYYPKENSLFVLEVNSGFAQEKGIEVGDTAKLNTM